MSEPAEVIPLWVEHVRAARRGDELAWTRLYQEFAPTVHGVVLGRVPVSEAEDLVHEVFITAMGKLASLMEDRAFGGWIVTIARRKSIDYLRGRRDEVPLSEEHTGDEDDAGPVARPLVAAGGGDAIRASAEATRALEAIRALPDSYRETLILRLVEGMSGPEIAARTGLTAGSVRVNLHRGMKLLREALQGSGS